ncbi:hypothetical protein AGOR_G00124690 [Albula goreensis]|uniref:Uncharacterized protein n=1 Tax=Albula goreensis TaxID=1534307 RepID=A0A8T3D9S6_9TELE|nr:hypothetical protein AGOR_G00124690 [Albula goreensis]
MVPSRATLEVSAPFTSLQMTKTTFSPTFHSSEKVDTTYSNIDTTASPIVVGTTGSSTRFTTEIFSSTAVKTAGITAHKETILTIPNAVKPSLTASTTPSVSSTVLAVTEPPTTKLSFPVTQVTKNNASQVTQSTSMFTSASGITSPSAVSSSAFPVSRSRTLAHSEVSVSDNQESTPPEFSTAATSFISTFPNLLSSSSQITRDTLVSLTTSNQPSVTTMTSFTLSSISTVASPTYSSQSIPALTPEGATVTTAGSALIKTLPDGNTQIITSKESIKKSSSLATSAATSAHSTTVKLTTAPFPVCEGSRVTKINLKKITSKQISVSWSGKNLTPDMEYIVKLKQGSDKNETVSTERRVQFTDLLPGVTYTLIIEYLSCGGNEQITRNITTAAKIYESSTRIPDDTFLPAYKNHSSPKFKEYVANFKEEIKKNLPMDYQNFIKQNDMRFVVIQIRRGSVIIDFDLITNVDVELSTPSIRRTVINALNMSALKVDFNQTTVIEADTCDRGSDLCSENGNCIRDGPTYVCKCKEGFRDHNPSIPGTDCQKDALTTVSPSSGQTTHSGKDNCDGKCSSLAECTSTPAGKRECQCYDGLIDENTSNPGKLCRDPVDCFHEVTNLCSSGNKCLKSKSVCSLKNLFKSTVELKSWQFHPALYNPENQDWKTTSTNFTIAVEYYMRHILSDESFNLSIVGFQRGSVVVRMVFGFDGDNTLYPKTLEKALQDGVSAHLDKHSSVTVEAISLVEENSRGGWQVATIVLGVVLGIVVLVIVIAGVAFALRRRVNCSRSYNVHKTEHNGSTIPTGTYGKYIYQDV